MKQAKLTKAARGRDCTVRIPGCPNNTETTVLAHYRLAGTCGAGIKPNNLQGAWCCDYCHSVCDGRIKAPEGMTREDIRLAHAEGVMRTIDILVREGVVAA
ncbi:DUF1364 domain-containing protein [Stutzerimonas stutzeri]|uniref:DUF1364 domain-containing protein n=1 Tax=Stutzerimonas stutzeri TaxID=316 RepID=UPI003EE307FD